MRRSARPDLRCATVRRVAAPTTIAVCNTKGGSGKSTTAAFAAHALHERGRRVLVVDADPQASALKWHEAASWPMPCVALPSARLHRDLPGIVGDRWDTIVVDTPGTEHGRGITLSAVRAATHVLIPSAPTPIEYERLRALRTLLDEAAELDAEFAHGVLLTRAVAGAASTAVFRDVMTGDGWRVLRPVVPRWERFAQSFGLPIEHAAGTGYGWAVDELLEGTR